MAAIVLRNGRPTIWNPQTSCLEDINIPPKTVQTGVTLGTVFPTLDDAFNAVNISRPKTEGVFVFMDLIDPQGRRVNNQ